MAPPAAAVASEPAISFSLNLSVQKPEDLQRCYDSRNQTTLFVGTSHIRELLCYIIDAPSKSKQCWSFGIGAKGTHRTGFAFFNLPFLELATLRSPRPMYDNIVIGRGAWDLVFNSTNPVDVYDTTLQFLRRILKFRRPETSSVVMYLPHFFQQPSFPAYQPCVVEGRVRMHRDAIERATFDANEEVVTAGGKPITIFDIYNLTRLLPRRFADGWGHHYNWSVLGPMVTALTWRLTNCGENGEDAESWFREPQRVDVYQGTLQGPEAPVSCHCTAHPYWWCCPAWLFVTARGLFPTMKHRIDTAQALLCEVPKTPSERWATAMLLRQVAQNWKPPPSVWKKKLPPGVSPVKQKNMQDAIRDARGVVRCLEVQGRNASLQTLIPDTGVGSPAARTAVALLKNGTFPICACINSTHLGEGIENQARLNGVYDRKLIEKNCGNEFGATRRFFNDPGIGTIGASLSQVCWDRWSQHSKEWK